MSGDLRDHIAVVGFGYWGPNHVRVLNELEGLNVTIVEPVAAGRRRAEDLFPGVPTVASLEDLEDPVDGVIICSPPSTHLSIAIQAFAMGAHVLVEKPLADSSSDAEAIVDAARAAERSLMVGHIYDFHAATAWLDDSARASAFGDIRYLDAARLAVGGYRTDVNVMWDMAPHDLCLMHRVMGQWPDRVSAWCVDHSGRGIPDMAHMRLEFQGLHAVGYIHVSWLDPVKVRRFTVVGEERMAVFNDISDPTYPIRVTETGATPLLGAGAQHPIPGEYPSELVNFPLVEQAEPLRSEVEHFVHCVRTGEPPTRSSGEDGLAVVNILEAADRSALTGEREVVSFSHLAPVR